MTSSAFRFQSLHHLIRNQSLIKKPFDLKYSAKSLRSFATHTTTPTTEHLFDTKYLHEMIKSNQTQEKFEYIQQIMDQFHHFKIPPHSFVEEVLHKTIEHNKKLPNVVPVFCHPSTNETEANAVTICGDTHGQYQDFRLIFGESIGGFPSIHNRFIFNGDMVDRGKQSLEIVMSLSLFQILFPKEQIVTITRGNHESIMMTKNYGFAHEVRHKYAQHHTSLYKLFLQYFNSLPFGAVVEKRIFVVHGGLGPQTYDKTIHELNQLRRFGDEGSPPDEFSPEIHDILWADPKDNVKGFAINTSRGGGYFFGPQVTEHFLVKNELNLLVRSHECRQNGYTIEHQGFCLTIFSAPNYCGSQQNLAAILRVKKPVNATEEKPFEFELKQFYDHRHAIRDNE